jgi:hypothetical protein
MNNRIIRLEDIENIKNISARDIFKVITGKKGIPALCLSNNDENISFCVRGGGKSIKYMKMNKSDIYYQKGRFLLKKQPEARIYFPQNELYRLLDELLTKGGVLK